MEKQRNPTEFNTDLLRSWAMDYFTEKAAAFNERFKERKYEAAVYIKDEFDAVYGFCERNGAFGSEDLEKIFGSEEKSIPPMVLPEREAVARMQVDGVIQDKAIERFTNLIMRMRHSFQIRLKDDEAKDAILIMDETLEQARNASERMKKGLGR